MTKGILKGPSNVTDACDSTELANVVTLGQKHCTQRDERDMNRMGKLQELGVSSTYRVEGNPLNFRKRSGNSSF